MKKNKLRIIVFLILIVVLIFVFISLYNKSKPDSIKNEIKTPVVLNELKKYEYSIHDNDTKYYRDMFNVLKDSLNKDVVDKNKYAELVSKLFLSDLFTLENKVSKNDIGGVEFISALFVENYKENISNTLYKYLETNIYGDRKQELPVVKEIKIIDIDEITYEKGKEKIENSYKIKANIIYEKDLGYKNEALLYIIPEDFKLVVVEMQ